MNIDDLRATLRERAGTVTDHDPVQRVGQVRARVRVARRRRIAGIAALAAGVLVVAGAVSVLPDKAPDITRPADPLPVIQHDRFVSHSGQYDLILAEVGERGQNTLELTIPPGQGQLYVSMLCEEAAAIAGQYGVTGYSSTAPGELTSQGCSDNPAVPKTPGVNTGPSGNVTWWGYLDGISVRSGADPVTVHIELAQDQGSTRATRASNPDALIGLGVYRVADPVATVATFEIPPRVGLGGQDYAYVDHRASQPGERSLTWTLEASATERYFDVVAANIVDPDTPVTMFKVAADCSRGTYGYNMPRRRAGGCLLSPGEPHTITVTVEGGTAKDGLLGITLYERTGP
jgi:hypothetical protein